MRKGILFLLLSYGLNFYCLKTYAQTPCAYDVTATMSPAPTNCQYYTNDSVEICFSIGGFTQSSSNWIHGFVFDIGSGWDTSTLKVTQLPYSCSGNGYWAFYKKDSSYSTGATFGPGIYYDWNTFYTPADGIPGNNYGDENIGFCTWRFCVKITASSVPSNDLHFSIRATSDGVTGGWSNPPSCQVVTNYSDSSCNHHITSIYKCNMKISTIATNPGCVPNTGAITVNETGGAGNVTYKWSYNNLTSSTISNLAPGVYNVTATDGHQCTQIATDTLRTNDSVRINLAVLDTIFCNGHCDGRLTIQHLSGNPPFNYQWSNGETTDTISKLCAGIYQVKIKDKHQCLDSASFNLSAPPTLELSFKTTNTSCYQLADGAALAIISPATNVYDYAWSPSGQSTDIISTQPALSNVLAGSYTVTVTESNGCITTGDTVITEPPRINLNLITQNVKCFGGNNGFLQVVPVSGFQPFHYLWNDNTTNSSISGLAIAHYSVTVTDNTGCSTDTSQTITEPDALRIDFTTYPASCDKATDGYVFAQVYGGVTPYSYFWNNKQTGDSAVKLTPGDYFVTVTDDNKCQDTGSTHLVAFARFSVDAGPDQDVIRGYSVNLIADPSVGGSYDYLWNPFVGVSDPNNSATVATPPVTTTYTVTVINRVTGCEATDDVVINVLPNSFLLVPNAFSPNGDAYNNTIFPIPGDGVTIKSFAIFNRWGTNVYIGNDKEGWDGTYNGTAQEIGVYTYYCLYTLPDGTESRKQGTILLLR